MADLFSTLASIVASYLPAVMFFLGCSVAAVGTGALVLRAIDALAMYLIASGPAYADLLRFLRWRFRTPDKTIDPLRLYNAAADLYLSARWTANNLMPERQTELWVALRDAMRLPPGTGTAKGLGPPDPNNQIDVPYNAATDKDPELVLARIAYSNAQCSTDALAMRAMATAYLKRKSGLRVVPPLYDPTDGRTDR